MIREYMVMLLIIGGSVLAILVFVNKKNIRKAFLAVIVGQQFTWPIGLLMVSSGKIEYPVRLFSKGINSSFLHGYLMNPVIFAIYYINYPKRAKLIWRWLYTLLITGMAVSIEVIENKYTNLIKYNAWNGYYSWISLLITYFIVRRYLDWFLKNLSKKGVQK